MTTENSFPNTQLTCGEPSRTKKRRGGQPGNQNARKHGYFSKVLDEKGQAELARLPPAADQLEAAFQRQNIKFNRIVALDITNERVIAAAGRRLLEFRRTIAVQRALRTNEPFRQAVRELLGKYGVTPTFPTAVTPENKQPGTEKVKMQKITKSRKNEKTNRACRRPRRKIPTPD